MGYYTAENEWHTITHYSMDVSAKHNVEEKKLDMEEYVL